MNNTAFISYRREPSTELAFLVAEALSARGIDVFLDRKGLKPGVLWDATLKDQIAARPYFLLILSPGTLERCRNAGDVLRQEIEQAVRLQRMIVPLMTQLFDLGDIHRYLDRWLAETLVRFQAITINYEYFDAAMEKLRAALKPIDLPVTPPPESNGVDFGHLLEKVKADSTAIDQQLAAMSYFDRATARPANDLDGKIADYTNALQLYPQYVNALINRGVARKLKGDVYDAITDYNKAIHIFPEFPEAYSNRGNAFAAIGDFNSAVVDFNRAIELDPQYAEPYYNRGSVWHDQGDLESAVRDYSEAIRLNPQYIDAYVNRGIIHYLRRNLEKATADYDSALQLNPNCAEVYYNRAFARVGLSNFAGAITDAERFIQLTPYDPRVHTLRTKLVQWRSLMYRNTR